MDWAQLESFYHIATQGSLSKAAEVVHRTQPALSQQLKTFENSLGYPLFKRLGRQRLVLTEEGQRVLAFAEDVFLRHGRLLDELETVGGRHAGRLRLAAGTATLSLMLPGVVRAFRKACPEARLTLFDRPPEQSMDMLGRGKVDLAVALESQTPSHLVAHHWLTGHYALMTAADHPLTRASCITLEDIARCPIIKLPSNVKFASAYRIEQAFFDLGLRMDLFLEAGNIYLMAEYVRRGFGVSLVTSLENGLPLFPGELAFIPLDHLFAPERILICTRGGTAPSPLAQTFLGLALRGRNGGPLSGQDCSR